MGDAGLTPWRAENRLMAAQHRANGIFSKLPFVQAVKVRKLELGQHNPTPSFHRRGHRKTIVTVRLNRSQQSGLPQLAQQRAHAPQAEVDLRCAYLNATRSLSACH